MTALILLVKAKHASPPHTPTPWWEWTIPALNTRETALVIWLVGVLLLLVATKRDVRQAVGSIFRTFFGSVWLLGPTAVAAAYATGIVLVLRQFGKWSDELTKVAVIWFFGFAFLAMFRTQNVDATYYRRLAFHTLGLAVVVEFVSNLHTFPLPVELVLVPGVLLLGGVQAVADSDPKYGAVRKFTVTCLTLIGLAGLSFSLVYLAHHADRVVTVEKTKAFMLPLVLTLAFLPFLVLTRFVILYQTILVMTRAGIDDPKVCRFARRVIVRTCRMNLGKVQLFDSQFRGQLWGVSTRQEVVDAIAEFKRAWAAGARVNVPEETDPI
jgi:hypothetical protein